jgi:STE24 endopeptidase
VNEPKSARYHRLKRRASLLSLCGSAALLAALLFARPVLPVWAYVLLFAVLHEIVTLPVAVFRGHVLDRRYELSSEPFLTWLRDHLKGFAIGLVLMLLAAEVVYALIAWNERWWWLAAAAAGAAATVLLVRLAPVLLLPLFFKFTPLTRGELSTRLLDLSRRAGVRVLGVYEWGLGAKTRRANAALVGTGGTRRILLSDTLLAEYTDDEIEVILAHELAHHVHGDIAKGLALEFLLLLASGYAAARAISLAWQPLGLRGVGDPAGLPVLALAAGAVMLAATPLVNAFSRLNERRADRFALDLTRRHDAFVTAMRRLGVQNLAEESPSRASVWLFHSHPPIAERIAAARGGQAP